MEELDSDVPLPKQRLKVGIIFNLKKGIKSKAEDAEAELDHIETVEAIEKAIKNNGYETVLIEADSFLENKLKESGIDIAFNIAEGTAGRSREARVPIILDNLGIPYTGADGTTLCIALDKALTKRLLSTYKIKTPAYFTVSPEEIKLKRGLRYPVIVKPNAEGSSKGISDISIAQNKKELKALIKKNIDLYNEEMLVEEYIEGSEFTVGVLGNGDDTNVFEPMEIKYNKPTQGSFHVYSYTVKQHYKEYIKYKCPSDAPAQVTDEMKKIADTVFKELKCRDFTRMDFRVTEDGTVYFIEVNPLPGLAPGYSDYPMLAEFCGTDYEPLVVSILRAALKRCGFSGNGGASV